MLRLKSGSQENNAATQKVFKTILDTCKDNHECFHCSAFNGVVKKLHAQGGQAQKPFKIIHDKYKKIGNEVLEEELAREFDLAMTLNKDFEQGLRKAFEEIDPLKTYRLFENIREEDVILFDMDYKKCHPTDFLVTHMPAPPVCIRPSVAVS